MKLELQPLQALRGPLHVTLYDLPAVPAVGGHGHRVPDLDQEGLQVVGDPAAVRVSVLHSEENVPGGDQAPLWHGSYPDGEPAAVTRHDQLPAGPVEDVTPEMLSEQEVGLIDHLLGHHHPGQVLPQYDLQTEEQSLLPFPTTALEV